MTLASTGEGLAKMLMGPHETRSDFAEADINNLRQHIEKWAGNKDLRSRLVSDVERAGTRTVGKFLRDLVRRGTLEARHANAWSDVRNEVMHGNMVSPWSTVEEEKRLEDLADLVHLLTRELIRKSAA